MKKQVFLSFVFLTCSLLNNTAQNFTWVRGDNTSGPVPGVYGTLGIPTASTTPGHRHGAGTWTDASGNLWLYGGEGYASSSTISWLSDLWKYSPTANQWTWIRGANTANAAANYGTQGVAAASNEPGAREFPMCWIDNSGNFWMFGGANNAGSGWLGDLWKYAPSTNTWVWMKGFNTVDNNGVYGTIGVSASGNMPGCRTGAARWVDNNGDLWLFGGRGFAATGSSGVLNDLWKYSISTNNWTWMGGTNSVSQPGVYGTLGVASTTCYPGGNEFPSSWTDNQGKFYILTGRGYTNGSSQGYTCDLWKYNPTTSEWTWLKGPGLTNQVANYGQQGVSAATNQPGGRYASAYWKDPSGVLWFFGGLGWVGSPTIGTLNDLWKYDPATNQFTWMKGSSAVSTNGTYGTMGIPSPSNMPGGRMYTVCWTSGSTLWLYGSEGYDISSISPDNMNDLWKFDVPCNPDNIAALSGNPMCSGGSATLSANNQFPASVAWYSSPTSSISVGAGSVLTTPTLSAAAGPSVYTYYAQSNSCTMTPRTSFAVTVNPLPFVGISGSNVSCYLAPLTLTATGATTYTWQGSINALIYVALPTTNTVYTVVGTDFNGCSASASINVSVIPVPTVLIAGTTSVCTGASATLSASGASTYVWSTGVSGPTLSTASLTTNTVVYVTGTSAQGCIDSTAITIVVRPLPTINATASRTIVCSNYNETATLTATGASNYTWSSGSSASTAVVSPTTIVVYTVTGSDSFGCASTSTIAVKGLICGGIGEREMSMKLFSVYPNPNHGDFVINCDPGIRNAHINIVNLLGQVIHSEKITSREIRISREFAKGLYFVNVLAENEVLGTARMIIE